MSINAHSSAPDRLYVRAKSSPVISPWAAEVIDAIAKDGRVKVWVFFTDKGFYDDRGMMATAAAKGVGLPARAAARRVKMGRDRVMFLDVAVRDTYVNRVREIGATLRRESRWLNAASFDIAVDQLDSLANLPFVAEIRPMITYRRSPEVIGPQTGAELPGEQTYQSPNVLNYGGSLGQLTQINVPAAHTAGYHGEGVRVCMIDTGYKKDHTVFAIAYSENRVIGEYDFIFDDGNTQDESPEDSPGQHSHGTNTWSILGGELDGTHYGPAFKAEFLLAKTEYVPTETQVEEDNWVAAMEWADANGADIISSSLGYTTFDSPPDYVAANFNGDFCVTTKAADSAAVLGIIVCNSAGNAGFDGLGAPADADSILTVGSVLSTGAISSFSSRGPTADGRIKPEVCAQGSGTHIATSTSTTSFSNGNGTSYSCPLVGGAAALVLQAHPSWTPMQVRDALMATASQHCTPNNNYGWGIIDVMAAINYDGCNEPCAPSAPYTTNSNPCNGETYQISWTPVTGATAYELYENGNLIYDGPLAPQSLSHVSGSYTYTVKGKIGCGAGAESPVGGATTINGCGCHGDPVCDGSATVLDVVTVVGEAFRNVASVVDPSCTHASRSDLDCDCFVTVLDVVRMVSVAFRNGDPQTEICNACVTQCP